MTEPTAPPALMTGLAFHIEAVVTRPDGTTDQDDAQAGYPATTDGEG